MAEAPTPWWVDLYDDAVADVLLQRSDPAEVDATVDFLVRALELAPGARVFDQCCGIGTLAVPLAQRGVRVIGVEGSARYVERARAAALGLPCRFIVGDAFAFVPEEPCDGALCWGTSFGNAETDEDNLRMLQRAYEGLRPGGRFVLDYQHVARLLGSFQPALIQHGPLQPDGTRITLLRESQLDLPRGVLAQRWTVLTPEGRRRETRSEVRLYLPHELLRLLRAAGFSDVDFFGDLHWGALQERSPRCVVVARRPA